MLFSFLFVYTRGSALDTQSALGIASGPGVKESLPANLLAALSLAFGGYERLIDPDDLLSYLQAADIVLIGEAHFDQRDMESAFEIIRLLAQRRKIALAMERFPLSLQPRLEALNRMDSEELREEGMRRILQTDEYQTVWGMKSTDYSGFPDPYRPSYPPDLPSTEAFEAMTLWAARARIPIIDLDLPLSERALGLGEDIPYRNEVWKNQIENYLEKNQSENYLVVAIGGIDHFSNGPDSVQAKLRRNPSPYQFLSIGQRDANYSTQIPLQVEDLAYGINDLILQSPEFAVAFQSGSNIFPTPPEYWIAVHPAESWEK